MISTVRTESAAVSAMARQWPMIVALLGGTSAMRDAGASLLPKWPNEEQKSYDARLSVATLYPAFARTVEVLSGKPFSKEAKLSESTPETVKAWAENIDLQGRNLHSFAAELLRDCIAFGVAGVLVDFPPVAGVTNRAEERAVGARPYFVRYAPGNVLGWRSERIAGVEKLVQLRLLESVTIFDGAFGEKVIEQVRVLTPGAWQTWRQNEKKEWIPFEDGVTTIKEIPFVFFYGIRSGYGTGKPPLLDLAHLNVEHWQSSSDQQTILHVARVPILTVIGAEDGNELTVGASTAVKLPMGSDMKYVEHSGAAISAGRESILDLEERMQKAGGELLQLKPGNITATQVNAENEANKCTLQRIVEVFEDGLDQCLAFACAWIGESVGGEVELYKAFGEIPSDASMETIIKAVALGIVSGETAFYEMQRRGMLASSADWDEQSAKLEMAGPALGMAE